MSTQTILQHRRRVLNSCRSRAETIADTGLLTKRSGKSLAVWGSLPRRKSIGTRHNVAPHVVLSDVFISQLTYHGKNARVGVRK